MSVFHMTKTLFGSMFKGPATIKKPYQKLDACETIRGSIQIEIDKCIYCGICKMRCPTGAISVEKPKNLWAIDRLDCIQCGYCVSVCPKKCLSMDNHYTAPSTGSVKDEYTNARVSDHQENS